jgi:GTP cyclohydrolase I
MEELLMDDEPLHGHIVAAPATIPPTAIRAYDYGRVRAAVGEMLMGMGYDPNTDESVRDTPDRVARAWAEMLVGNTQSVEAVLDKTFDAGRYDQLVLLKDIDFDSTCEHHLLPFRGKASVAYIPEPDGRVVGLSKLARVVEIHARKLQLQERMTRDIANDIEMYLNARAVAVVIHATHHCMCSRGVRKPGAMMVTSDLRGTFRTNVSARAEVLGLMR